RRDRRVCALVGHLLAQPASWAVGGAADLSRHEAPAALRAAAPARHGRRGVDDRGRHHVSHCAHIGRHPRAVDLLDYLRPRYDFLPRPPPAPVALLARSAGATERASASPTATSWTRAAVLGHPVSPPFPPQVPPTLPPPQTALAHIPEVPPDRPPLPQPPHG